MAIFKRLSKRLRSSSSSLSSSTEQKSCRKNSKNKKNKKCVSFNNEGDQVQEIDRIDGRYQKQDLWFSQHDLNSFKDRDIKLSRMFVSLRRSSEFSSSTTFGTMLDEQLNTNITSKTFRIDDHDNDRADDNIEKDNDEYSFRGLECYTTERCCEDNGYGRELNRIRIGSIQAVLSAQSMWRNDCQQKQTSISRSYSAMCYMASYDAIQKARNDEQYVNTYVRTGGCLGYDDCYHDSSFSSQYSATIASTESLSSFFTTATPSAPKPILKPRRRVSSLVNEQDGYNTTCSKVRRTKVLFGSVQKAIQLFY